MEIEKKFLVTQLPDDLAAYPHHEISQAYISTNPVIRVRRLDHSYLLTIKSDGLLAREETEMPISERSFSHLLSKKDGNNIEKTRYLIPDKNPTLTIELDVFHGSFEGFIMAEVEFQDLDQAANYCPPSWFGREVTSDARFQNACLSRMTPEETSQFLGELLLTES